MSLMFNKTNILFRIGYGFLHLRNLWDPKALSYSKKDFYNLQLNLDQLNNRNSYLMRSDVILNHQHHQHPLACCKR